MRKTMFDNLETFVSLLKANAWRQEHTDTLIRYREKIGEIYNKISEMYDLRADECPETDAAIERQEEALLDFEDRLNAINIILESMDDIIYNIQKLKNSVTSDLSEEMDDIKNALIIYNFEYRGLTNFK